MALDDLIARLEQDADAQVASLARSADAAVAAIVAATEQELSARTTETLASARRARQVEDSRALADHQRQLRGRELAAAYAVLDRVFARARERLARVEPPAAWMHLWPALAHEALSDMGGRPCRVRGNASVIGCLRSAACLDPETHLTEDHALGPGLMVEALDGSVRIDATLDTLLSQRRDHLAMGLLQKEVRDAI